MRKALITGITGQDGSYLTEFLLNEGYEVHGLVRRSSHDPFIRIPPQSRKRIKVHHGNLRDYATIREAIQDTKPDEIYNLAAQSHVGLSFKLQDETWEVNYHGLGRLIHEAVRVNHQVRIYQASTSEMFGNSPSPQNESTPFNPQSPYAEAKTKAHEDFVVGYRARENLFICSGFLFNHESERRGEQFVTRKITKSMAEIKAGVSEGFSLGNLNAKRDWGFAGDYVSAMWLMLQQDKADDYVIATGETRTVRDFVIESAKAAGISLLWEGSGLDEKAIDENGRIILNVDEEHYRPAEVNLLLGDYSKAKRELEWSPKTSFEDLVRMMVKHDLKSFSK